MRKKVKISLIILLLLAFIYSGHKAYVVYNNVFAVKEYNSKIDMEDVSQSQKDVTGTSKYTKTFDVNKQDSQKSTYTMNSDDSKAQDSNDLSVNNSSDEKASNEDKQLPGQVNTESKNNEADGKGEKGSASISDVIPPNVSLPIDSEKVESKAENIAGGDVDIGDYFTIGYIALSKLSSEEIKYLFNSAKSDYFLNTPVDEIENTRQILFSKLSAGDLDTLRAIGRKYGYSMDLLNPDIDVAAEKAKVMKRYGRE